MLLEALSTSLLSSTFSSGARGFSRGLPGSTSPPRLHAEEGAVTEASSTSPRNQVAREATEFAAVVRAWLALLRLVLVDRRSFTKKRSCVESRSLVETDSRLLRERALHGLPPQPRSFCCFGPGAHSLAGSGACAVRRVRIWWRSRSSSAAPWVLTAALARVGVAEAAPSAPLPAGDGGTAEAAVPRSLVKSRSHSMKSSLASSAQPSQGSPSKLGSKTAP
mmetsp:Transcript_63004/g.162213  ORF Transcript_63004/g.162213 Transcript_63004/m.162213 type:complete len:221 (-) Transcript_63004:825-1487(-)